MTYAAILKDVVYFTSDNEIKPFRTCNSIEDANKLARELNNGAVYCKGSKELGTACGKCVVCQLSV